MFVLVNLFTPSIIISPTPRSQQPQKSAIYIEVKSRSENCSKEVLSTVLIAMARKKENAEERKPNTAIHFKYPSVL